MADFGPRGLVFLINSFDVGPIDPDPGAGVPLIALAEEEAAAAAGDGDEVLGLEVNFEPEGLNIIVAAGGDVAHAEYGRDSAEGERG